MRMADAVICGATLQAGVPAARSRWYGGRLVLVRLGCEGIRCADAIDEKREVRFCDVPVGSRSALACSAGRGPRRGRDAIFNRPVSLPRPRHVPRDRSATAAASLPWTGPVVSLPPPFNRGAEGKLRDGGSPSPQDRARHAIHRDASGTDRSGRSSRSARRAIGDVDDLDRSTLIA